MQHQTSEEQQYLNLIRRVLDHGIERPDRTGIGTLSIFGVSTRWSLREGTLPLLTTKRMFWRGIAEELLWFISGSTNTKDLSEKGIKFWDANASRPNLDKLGFDKYPEGELGPTYGHLWRNFGGVDQLGDVIKTLRINPTSRRMLVSAWNPPKLKEMVLPPCHVLYQFYVDTTVEPFQLSCQVYQRSGDLGLGVPFNIASYALLTHLVARLCGFEAKELIHVLGDAHIYSNHVDALRTQLVRKPLPFPTLEFRYDAPMTNIDDLKMEHLLLKGYKHFDAIHMPMAV